MLTGYCFLGVEPGSHPTHPTDPFTTLELQYLPHDVSEQLKIRPSPDFRDIKPWKCRSQYHLGGFQGCKKKWKKSLPLATDIYLPASEVGLSQWKLKLKYCHQNKRTTCVFNVHYRQHCAHFFVQWLLKFWPNSFRQQFFVFLLLSELLTLEERCETKIKIAKQRRLQSCHVKR